MSLNLWLEDWLKLQGRMQSLKKIEEGKAYQQEDWPTRGCNQMVLSEVTPEVAAAAAKQRTAWVDW